jgi:hypothetical protein
MRISLYIYQQKIIMFMRIAAIASACFILLSCNQRGKYYDHNPKDSSKRSFIKADSSASGVQPVDIDLPANDLQPFCNNEITPYCVLLPLQEFKEDFSNQSIVKAQHKFLLRKDSASFTSIEVQGFSIDAKNNYNTALFYNRDKRDVEEGGLGIDTAYMNAAEHLYVIKGHLPNYPNMKFIQLNWILEDRVAVYVNYDEKDEELWQKRIAAIIKKGIQYNPSN